MPYPIFASSVYRNPRKCPTSDTSAHRLGKNYRPNLGNGSSEMPKKNEPHTLSVPRCKRLVRPLLAKVHSLTDLHSKYPAKLVFDSELFGSDKNDAFTSPASANDRLILLKPYLAQEVYEAYTEIFNIFKNIVSTLSPVSTINAAKSRPNKVTKPLASKKTATGNGSVTSGENKIMKLSTLASIKLGKSIALGTKSTHYSLNQTALFDPLSIPVYLRKYHDQLAEDIDEWLQMDPAAVFGQHRAELLMGYVMHIFVFYLRMLFYTLIPVLCHWLSEQQNACLRILFSECWLFLHFDPDHEEVQDLTVADRSRDPSLGTFWLFHRIGYWQNLVLLLKVKSAGFDGTSTYEALFLDALICADRLDLNEIDVHEVYAMMRNNLQHPRNTQILVSIVAQFINSFRKTYSAASTSTAALEAITRTYHDIRGFVQAWLCLSKSCIFNTLDKGNSELFGALFMLTDHLKEKCSLVLDYLEGMSGSDHVAEAIKNFRKALSDVTKLESSCRILEAFFLDTPLPRLGDNSASPATTKYFTSFIAEDCDDETIDVFVGWLDEQDHSTDIFVSSLRRQMASFQH